MGAKTQYSNKNEKTDHLSPATVEKYLAGMHYPAKKQALLDNARGKKAPEVVMNLLSKLPEKTCKSPIDITKEIGKIE